MSENFTLERYFLTIANSGKIIFEMLQKNFEIALIERCFLAAIVRNIKIFFLKVV